MNKIYIISILAIAMAMASCGDDFLNPSPTAAVSEAGFYETESQLEAGVISMYDGLQGDNSVGSNDNRGVQIEFYMAEMLSDNTRTKSFEGEAAAFEGYTVASTNGIVTDYYRSMYDIIFRANTVLANIDVASEKRAQFEGEAKFVRAHAFFNLVRIFGDVPMIDEIVNPLDTDKQFTRVGGDQIYDLIISDLGTAMANLGNDGSKNRASKAAAQALLAKVHLTRGNYTEAQSLCEAVVGSGFALEPNFMDIFTNEGNGEVIFAIGYASDDAENSQNFSSEWLNAVGRTTGVNYVTDEAVAALDAIGGARAASYRVDDIQPIHNQVTKYLPDSGDPVLAGNDWIVLRYGDVLLMHVEAIMAGASGTTSAAALSSFNAVRERAGLGAAAGEITKQMLIDERRVELAFENQRFFDLKRFGVAQAVLSEYSTNNGYSFDASDLLLPIPQREINLSNGLLSQNPGY